MLTIVCTYHITIPTLPYTYTYTYTYNYNYRYLTVLRVLP
jgi:hypothetical protein